LCWKALLKASLRETKHAENNSYYRFYRRHRLINVRTLVSQDHHVLLHWSNPAKLKEDKKALSALTGAKNIKSPVESPVKYPIESYVADFSRMSEVEKLANEVTERHDKLDVLINNAGF
jgi:NAD(P)-dependent dehydrogenase (short-subunit alcohol dehydrogenase family)